jgi:hypothetical protein
VATGHRPTLANSFDGPAPDRLTIATLLLRLRRASGQPHEPCIHRSALRRRCSIAADGHVGPDCPSMLFNLTPRPTENRERLLQ